MKTAEFKVTYAFLIALALTAVPYDTQAASQHITLSPDNTKATIHARSVVTDIDGSFSKVSGSLDYDLEKQTCHVDITMDVDSIVVGSAVLRQVMLSGIMLDSDTHPSMHYVGNCTPKIVKGQLHTLLNGNLTMKGKTHPVSFETVMHFDGNTLHEIVSTAEFNQTKWGVSTLLHSVDPMVKAQTVITLK